MARYVKISGNGAAGLARPARVNTSRCGLRGDVLGRTLAFGACSLHGHAENASRSTGWYNPLPMQTMQMLKLGTRPARKG
jgi:hypothetical protein